MSLKAPRWSDGESYLVVEDAHRVQRVEVLLQQGGSGRVEVDLVQLQHRHRHPEQSFVHGRLLPTDGGEGRGQGGVNGLLGGRRFGINFINSAAGAANLAEQRLQLGQSDDGGLYQHLAVVVVGPLQAALQTLWGEGRGRGHGRRRRSQDKKDVT